MKTIYFSLFGIVFFLACSQSNNETKVTKRKVDPNELAVPHGKEFPLVELSEADKEKLAKAKGRKIEEIDIEGLTKMMEEEDKNDLHIFQFWSLDCHKCLDLNNHLIKMKNESIGSKIKLHFINLDQAVKKEAVNLYIREKGITDDIFSLNYNNPEDLMINGSLWNGDLPLIYIRNFSESIKMKYQRGFDYNEFYAILQTLTL